MTLVESLHRDVGDGRAKAWTERALREGSEAATRRDRARAEIADRQKLANALQRRNEREEQERLDELESRSRRQSSPKTEPTTEE